MSSDLQQAQDFQTRMFCRIRDQMGDLMTDAELKAVVEKSIQKAFFEPITEQRDYNTRHYPSLFQKMMTEELQPVVRKAANEWLDAHADEVIKQVNEVLGRSMLSIVDDYLSYKMLGSMEQLRRDFASAMGRPL